MSVRLDQVLTRRELVVSESTRTRRLNDRNSTRKPTHNDISARTVGHLTVQLAHIVGNLIRHFEKSQMPGGLPGGMISLGID